MVATPKIAMVTEAQARKGAVFRAIVNPRCYLCKYYAACASKLRPGGRYKVLSVRRKAHVCPLIRERMVVVEVEEMPLLSAVRSKLAVEGLTIRYERIICGNAGCPFYRICSSPIFEEGEPVKVVSVHAKIDCPLGFHLTMVELKPLTL